MTAERPAAESRILIVDDQEANVRLLERMLQRAGYVEVRSTTEAAATVGLAESFEPDLILLDLHMPHLDGYEVLAQLRAHRDQQGYLPVLVLTADASPSARHRALESGATDFVTKPLDAEEVLLRCRNLLQTRSLYQSVMRHNDALTGELLSQEGKLRTTQSAHALVLAALNHLEHGATLEERAAALVGQLSRSSEFDGVAILTVDGDGGITPIAVGGTRMFDGVLGKPVAPRHTAGLRDRWAAGPWASEMGTSDYGEPIDLLVRQTGLHSVWYAPVTEQGRVVGLLVAGSRREPEAQRLAAGLPMAEEFGAITRAALGAELAKRQEEAHVRQALLRVLSDGAFLPVFQPVVDLRSRQVVGYEALTRFADGIRPDLRFAEAHRVSLGVRLEEETMLAAVAAAHQLPRSVWLSLNVSPDLLLADGRLASILAGAGREVVLEITEHVAISDYHAVRRALRSLGSNVRVAIDDAGAGYASFRHVLEVEPDFVKLDADLVRGLEKDTARQALVVGMRYFAKQTGCALIAEGIETEAERLTLEGLTVTFGQGYLFGRPQSIGGTASPPRADRVSLARQVERAAR